MSYTNNPLLFFRLAFACNYFKIQVKNVKKGQQKQWVSVNEMADKKNFEGVNWGGGEALACERDIPRERRRTTPYTPGANQLSNSDTVPSFICKCVLRGGGDIQWVWFKTSKFLNIWNNVLKSKFNAFSQYSKYFKQRTRYFLLICLQEQNKSIVWCKQWMT